jgi:hypothetical protein
MPKEKAKSAAVGLEADLHNDTEKDIPALANEVGEQDIAALAHELWQARGCHNRNREHDPQRVVRDTD